MAFKWNEGRFTLGLERAGRLRALGNAVESDMVEFCKRHNLTAASFTATASDGKSISIFSVDNQTISGQCFEAALNVGRLWQHVRTQIKAGLDVFENWEFSRSR